MWFWTFVEFLVNVMTGGVWDWLSNLENLRWMIFLAAKNDKNDDPCHPERCMVYDEMIYDCLWCFMMLLCIYVILQMVSFRWSHFFRKKQIGFVARPAWEYTHETNHRTQKWNIYWGSACLPASGTLPELLKGIYRICLFWLCASFYWTPIFVLQFHNVLVHVTVWKNPRKDLGPLGFETVIHSLKLTARRSPPKKWWIFQ